MIIIIENLLSNIAFPIIAWLLIFKQNSSILNEISEKLIEQGKMITLLYEKMTGDDEKMKGDDEKNEIE